MADITGQLINEFKLKHFQVQNIVKLIDEGNTIPFIARYRKEMTGELNDQVLRELHERLLYLRNLEEKREDVKRLIEEQGRLTEQISAALSKAETLQAIDDIYRPFRPKRRTRSTIAKQRGLEPLARVLFVQELQAESIEEIAEQYIDPDKEVNSVNDALSGAMDIIAEEISDSPEYRRIVRDSFYSRGTVIVRARQEEDSVYRMYYDYSEPVIKIAPHRVLAINRGEKEQVLHVKIDVPDEENILRIKSRVIKKKRSLSSEYLERAVEDAYERLIIPSVENEVRNELTEKAEKQAMKVFAENLRNLLLQPPVKGKVVMGVDPAYRTGCKIAVVDDTGKLLDTAVVYPTPPQNKVGEAKGVLKKLIDVHKVDLVSIGNGTASRETEVFIADLLKEIDRKVYYMVVSESGASVYSASKLGAEEFPDFDVALRSAISIARRLQDPLAELVKIDPKAIGVGQYQHDMNQRRLGKTLGAVVEDSVNSVGVDLNTASPSLLSYVSGINSAIANNIFEYRELNGKFRRRRELLAVKQLGKKAFEQCAGFLRIPGGEDIFDNTSVHPESYDAANKLLQTMGYTLADVKEKRLGNLRQKVEDEGIAILADVVGIGAPTLKDIVDELLKPGRDPRDELPKPIFLTDVLNIEDLKEGMLVTGTVRNVADFGAFVDIGVHQDGLVHISELSDRFVRNPMEVVTVGDIVNVRIVSVDVERKRISLSMKQI